MDQQAIIVENQDELAEMDTAWVPKVLVLGGVLGALTGLGAAYLLVARSKKHAEPPNLSAMEGVRLGLLIFGLLRQVTLLGEDDKK